MNYTKTEWKNLPDTTTPITADALNNIEDGVEYLFEHGAGDSLPVGSELDYDGQVSEIPTGWTQVSEKTKILWTNEDPTSNFASQAITLNESLANYDMYEIAFKSATSVNEYITSGRIKTGYGGNIYQGWTTDSGVSGRTRIFQYTSDTTITFGNGSNGNNTPANENCIPLYVIGYVTNLFEEEE